MTEGERAGLENYRAMTSSCLEAMLGLMPWHGRSSKLSKAHCWPDRYSNAALDIVVDFRDLRSY